MQGIVRATARQGIGSALLALSLTFALSLAFVQRADAAGPSLFAEGLHISTGAIVDPNNHVWVADHNAGFCRIKPPGRQRARHRSTIRRIRARATSTTPVSAACCPRPAPARMPRVSRPSSTRRPSSRTAATSSSSSRTAPSPSADVVRADWNPDTGLFEFRDIITMDADTGEVRPRPVAVSASPDGNAYVVFQRSGTVQRIVDPESPNPTVDLVATTSDGRGAGAVAAMYGPGGPLSPPRIIVAETTGLREVGGTPADPGAPRTTVDPDFQLPAARAAGRERPDL